MISTNEFKNGMVIKWKGDLYQIVHFQHVKMQQRAPVIKTKMTRLSDGAVAEQSFRSGDKVEDVFMERKAIRYLYHEGNLYHFMDENDYNDVVVNKESLGDKINYMKDDTTVTGMYCDGELVNIELPASVVLTVTDTQPGFRGDTAKSGTKPAQLDTGAIVRVPLFVNPGDVLRVDTRTGEYIERVNS